MPTTFLELLKIISEKCVVPHNFPLGFQQPLLRSAFPHSHNLCKYTSVLEGTVFNTLSVGVLECLTPDY